MLYAVDIMTSRLILYFKRIFEMKKTLLFGLVFAVLLIVPVTAWAQRPVGDTLVTFDTDYLFSPYLDWFSSEDTGWKGYRWICSFSCI